MAKQVECPYCNSNLIVTGTEFTLGCPRCGQTFRLRGNKCYKNEEVAPEMLCYVVSLFGTFARLDQEHEAAYDTYATNFIKNQVALTRLQFEDLQKVYSSEKKSLFGFMKKYKDTIKELKHFIDALYKTAPLSEQNKAEDDIFSLLYRVAEAGTGITEEQNEVIQYFKTVFKYDEARAEQITSALHPKSNIKEEVPAIDPDLVFSGVKNKLSEKYVGHEEFIGNLLVGFKRPFILKNSGNGPKNVIAISAGEPDFVKAVISDVARLLYAENLLQGIDCEINLAEFAEEASYEKFLRLLQDRLNSSTEILVLTGWENTSEKVKNTLYAVLENGAVNVTIGTEQLALHAERKYIVLLTDKAEAEFSEVFGDRVMQRVTDAIKIFELSEEDIHFLINNLINQKVFQLRESLNIALLYDPNIIEFIRKSYSKRSGLKGISFYVEQNIVKPITEFKLKRTAPIEGDVVLGVLNEEFILVVEGNYVSLDKFTVKRKNHNTDEIKKRLNNVIGLDSVKEYILKLEDTVLTRRLREESGFKNSSISMNMIFTGNPGTGKTTIARIVAEFLAAAGMLQKGQLVEVSRGDLVGEYAGETAKKTTAKIKQAIGGVLFIDEAYALCRDKNDTYGLEAIDTLVKMMEDHREELVVILAGYRDEMTAFLKSNTGLMSRFPNIIEFPDYTPTEMYKIAEKIARESEYVIDSSCVQPLISFFETKNIKGKNDSGNGRLARNVVEKAIVNQSNRIINENESDFELLKLVDFELEEKEEFDLEEHLTGIIGLDNVKDFLRKQQNLLKAQAKRKSAGITTDAAQSLNMIFTGNPGTGKTTVARVVAEMLKEMGMLKSGQLVEADRSKLVAEYVGQTAKKTEEVFLSALGGVLFIDEAYALTNQNDQFGKEAVDTLVKLIEDYRGEICVILAGYKKEMSEFLEANSGLNSRFPLSVEFSDYTAEELYQIFLNQIAKKGFVLEDSAKEYAKGKIEQLHRNSDASSGNGRMVRNFVEEIIRNQSTRVALEETDASEMNWIIKADFGEEENQKAELFDLEAQFDKIIGLQEVKDFIRAIHARIKIQKERKKLGLAVNETQTLHMIFTGNPGTGKTTMARIIADLMYSLGVVSTNHFVETDRAGLVAGYVGQTAIKTMQVVQEALNGVLFIDEAYTLAQGGPTDFGREAIDTLLKLMEDNRDRLIVILAGYTEEMTEFLLSNPGLHSRFPNVIEFADYTTEELFEIGVRMFQNNGYRLSEEAAEKMKDILREARVRPRFGNGRFVRNLFEKAISNQSLRLSKEVAFDKETLMEIRAEDISG
ncbi:MAG: AAA family ATPase [Clostridia bacterium]|nr:AAA family ATPase [Clostridia bacterium]